MEESAGKIEIFAPCESAFELTKRILFQPFDLAKWCVIGFAAFLANLGQGQGFNFPNLRERNWNLKDTTHDLVGSVSAVPWWVIALIVFFVLVVITLVVVLTWVSSRGTFIFIDCVVRNRGAIVAPWKEFRREGDGLFFFRVGTGLILLLLLALGGFPLWWPLVHGTRPQMAPMIVGLALVAGVSVAFVFFWAPVLHFMGPIMYRRRCRALDGCRAAIGLVTGRPGPVLLFVLFNVVIGLALALVTCLLTCATCCVAAIPYVGTVIILPLHVFWMSFLLLFVRQFGPEYDVWANVTAVEPASPPPIQVPPEPPELPPGAAI